MEHLSLKHNSSLLSFCESLSKQLNNSTFKFDRENETEWAITNHLGLSINVSRPFEEGILQEWDDTVPADCNFGITISSNNTITKPQLDHIGNLISNTFNTKVFHHRTHISPSNNKKRENVYNNVP